MRTVALCCVDDADCKVGLTELLFDARVDVVNGGQNGLEEPCVWFVTEPFLFSV